MVRVGIGLSGLVVVGWIVLSIFWLRSEDLIAPAAIVLLAGGFAFLTLLVVWAAIALVWWIRQVLRASKDVNASDGNFAKPS